MLYVDIPTLPEFRALAATRADACVSIYLPTTPVSQETRASRIELKNLTKAALGQLDAIGFDKRRSASINNQLAELAADNEFWKYQAMSLGVLTNPETMRTFRLPNRLTAMVEVSDRFHLKPLIRAITFPHEAFVLALSENKVRLVEVFADLPAQEVKIPELPKSAAAAVRQSTINDRSPSGRIQGLEGQKVRLGQYGRQIDTALRPVLAGRDIPLILAATEPLASIFRSINTYPGLVDDTISTSPDTLKSAELATRARPILDRILRTATGCDQGFVRDPQSARARNDRYRRRRSRSDVRSRRTVIDRHRRSRPGHSGRRRRAGYVCNGSKCQELRHH